jgi:hypothetical protein
MMAKKVKYNLDEATIKKLDQLIKINVAATGDFTEPQSLMSRLIWNICFNPKERKRSMTIVNSLVDNSKYKDLPVVQGKMPD